VYQQHLDALIAFASGEQFQQELLQAKTEYFAGTGELFEDDKSFELRMASFLDFFVFDWKLAGSGKTPSELFFEQSTGLSEEEQQGLRGLTETRHSLWEVRKLAKANVRLRDLFTGKDIDVFERRQPAGLKRGDIIEARLVPYDGRLLFSSAFCFHPEEVRKVILKEVKRLKKHEPDFDRRGFIWSLSKMRLKLERYRNIAPEQIYSFAEKTI
jgi:hypothetical protein